MFTLSINNTLIRESKQLIIMISLKLIPVKYKVTNVCVTAIEEIILIVIILLVGLKIEFQRYVTTE